MAAPADPSDLVDLAAERTGGSVLFATDDFFASKDNLLKADEAVFIAGKYTDQGKWMDGWESRRRRAGGHDFAIVRLGMPGVVRRLVVDTAHFKGNYPLSCRVEATSAPTDASLEELEAGAWVELVGETALEGDRKNILTVAGSPRVTHLKLHIMPDGGVARLRVYGEVVADLRWMGKAGAEVDLASLESGATVPTASDMFFGSRNSLVLPGPGLHMGDGWETRRSGRVSTETDRLRERGADWAMVRLAAEGVVERVEIDTTHFKGNAPESAALEVAPSPDGPWTEIVARRKLQPHTRHFVDSVEARVAARYARLLIWPDGGVMRLRLHGALTARGREETGLAFARSLPDQALAAALRSCCASQAWVDALVAKRPFASLAELLEASARAWNGLSPADWEQAFLAHPRIGEQKPVGGSGAATATSTAWSRQEQSKLDAASPEVLRALAEGNRAYEAKFGRVYLVCATGKTGDELLAILEQRMKATPEAELTRAAAEQLAITELRLRRMIAR